MFHIRKILRDIEKLLITFIKLQVCVKIYTSHAYCISYKYKYTLYKVKYGLIE